MVLIWGLSDAEQGVEGGKEDDDQERDGTLDQHPFLPGDVFCALVNICIHYGN